MFLFGLSFQTFSNEATIADSLFNNKAYFDAAIAYERLIYFSTNFKEKNYFNYKKALCYKALRNFDKAKNILEKINPLGQSPEITNSIAYERALISYLDEDFEGCAKSLLLVNFENYDKNQQENLYVVATLNNIMLQNFKESEKYALKYAELSLSPENYILAKASIESLYSKKSLPKIKNAKVFEWLNIIPGFGQFYVGRIGEGFTNIALNLTFFSFGVYQIINGFYFTGYFVGTLSINKFYFGGRTNAKNAFTEVNKNNLVAFNKKIREKLSVVE